MQTVKVIQLYTDEKKLIQKAVKRDRKAQKHLFEKHAPKMLSVCRKYITSLEIAEEVLLNGFFKVFTKLDQYSYEGSFEGWVRKIIIRECIDHLRKKDPFKFSESIIEEKTHIVDDQDDCKEPTDLSIDVLQECIDSLPQGYKSVFVMHSLDHIKHKEIAKILNISENTSKTQYRKARLLLQEKIKQIRKQRYEA